MPAIFLNAQQRRVAARLAAVFVLLAATTWASVARAQAIATATVDAAEASPCVEHHSACLPRTADDVWCVSARCLGCPDLAGDPPAFDVSRYDLTSEQWSASSLDDFLAAQTPAVPTVFWVHGNRLYLDEARSQGMDTYRQLTRGVSGDRPIRFVIYSWPTAAVDSFVEDARIKAARTNSDGYYLAWLVNHIDRQTTVNFIGFSFGARIVTGALHLLGGGTLVGRALPEPIEPRAPMQAVILAAAVNNNWLAIGHKHGEALPIVQRMLAINNSCDRALKHYGAIDPCYDPEALGYTGAVGLLGENASKLREIDACCILGKQHSWASYFYSPGLVAHMRPYVGLAEE